MARKSATTTPIQKAAEEARKALAQAKERLAKADNDTNKKAVEHAKTALAEKVKAENRERFETVGGIRVGKVMAGINALGNVSARRSYDYDAADVNTAFADMETALKAARAKFDAALSAPVATAERKPATVYSFKR